MLTAVTRCLTGHEHEREKTIKTITTTKTSYSETRKHGIENLYAVA